MLRHERSTPEELRALREAVLADREEIEEQFRRARAAAAEPTFSGELRRRIHAAHPQVQLHQLEEAAGIAGNELVDFLEGLGELTTAQLDAICGKLGVTLTAVDKMA